MLKKISNIGSILNKSEQKSISGGEDMKECSLGTPCSNGFPNPFNCIPAVNHCCVNGSYEICG